MPMMLADAIGNVSLDSISDYAALDGHEALPEADRDLAKRSVRMGIEANSNVAQAAGGEPQRFSTDGDGYVFLSWTRLV